MGRWVWGLALAAGCGPELDELPPIEPAPLLEVCGQPSPVRILELAADQTLVSESSSAVRVDGRVYFVVVRSPTGSFGDHSDAVEPTVMSVGPCGESPRTIAANVTRVFTDPHYPGLVLGNAPQGVVVLDPDGAQSPRLLVPLASSNGDWTDVGIVERAPLPEVGDALVLHPYPSAPEEDLPPTVLHAPWPGRAEVRGTDVFFLLEDGVHAIALPDVASQRITSEAQTFEVTSDGRFVVWMTPEDAAGVTTVHVLDRSTGSDVVVDDIDGFVDVHDTGIRLRPLGWPDDALHSIVRFPSLQRVDLPEGVAVLGPADGTRWIAWTYPRTFLFDPDTGNTDLLFSTYGYAERHRDRIEVLVSDRVGSPELDSQGTLFAAPYDGEKYVLADRATPGRWRVEDGRIVTPLDVVDNVGVLAVTDFDGATRWQIDTDVLVWFARWQKHAGYESDVVLYSVSDGDRSGIWLARLPSP